MEEVINNLDGLVAVVISVLVALQTVVVYFLPPEKADKFNWVSKLLNILARTKSGISPRKDNDKLSRVD